MSSWTLPTSTHRKGFVDVQHDCKTGQVGTGANHIVCSFPFIIKCHLCGHALPWPEAFTLHSEVNNKSIATPTKLCANLLRETPKSTQWIANYFIISELSEDKQFSASFWMGESLKKGSPIKGFKLWFCIRNAKLLPQRGEGVPDPLDCPLHPPLAWF